MLASGGATVLLTTQYLDEADALAARIVVIDHGRVVADDTPAGIAASFGHDDLEGVFLSLAGSAQEEI